MINSITCFDDQGQTVEVAAENLIYQPTAHGILIENNQVLLQPHPITELWFPPGGPVKEQEVPETAVLRYFRQSASIVPRLLSLLFVEERYWLDQTEQAWHLPTLYYAVDRPSTGVTGLIDFDNPARPEWVPLTELKRTQLQFGYEAIQAGRLKLNI